MHFSAFWFSCCWIASNSARRSFSPNSIPVSYREFIKITPAYASTAAAKVAKKFTA
jgi:hypothetical protein